MASAKAMLTCIGPPVCTGFRLPNSFWPRGTMPMKSLKMALSSFSVRTVNRRCS
ncbi:hypothetical protein D3C80_2001370 [compost metagenome]